MTHKAILFGRTNVGKSSIFNQMTSGDKAIALNSHGVTRDYKVSPCKWDEDLHIIDTAGLLNDDELCVENDEIVQNSDIILFVIDGKIGLTEGDIEISKKIRHFSLPVILVINKYDIKDAESVYYESLALGFETISCVSAAHNDGILPLFDIIHEILDMDEKNDIEEDMTEDIERDIEEMILKESSKQRKNVKISIIGQPNVGKSTLINSLLQQNRALVSDVAGTTRDSLSEFWHSTDNHDLYLVDTAGIRRKSSISENIEQMSANIAKENIRLADIVICMINISTILKKQDLSILEIAAKHYRPVILLLNKTDLIDKKELQSFVAECKDYISYKLYLYENLFILPCSAKNNKGFSSLPNIIEKILNSSFSQFSTHQINQWLGYATYKNPPPLTNNKMTIRLKYANQVDNNPITIRMNINRLHSLPDSYVQYLLHSFYEYFPTVCTPVKMIFKSNKNPYS